MNPSVLINLAQIPVQLSGLSSLTSAVALALLAFIIPYSAVEMNVRAIAGKSSPGYFGLLTRIVVVLACLLSYDKLYGLFLGAFQALSFSVLSEQDWGNFLIRNLSAPDAASPILSWLTHPLSSVQAIVLFLSSLFALTAKDVIVMLEASFLSLLFAFGPIAIVCGISEKTSGVTRGWIVNSVQIASWSFFLRLVVRVWLTLGPLAANTGTGTANDFLGILAVNSAFFVMVLGTPILSARLISGEGLSSFAEAATGVMGAAMVGMPLKAGRFLGQALERGRKNSRQADFPLQHPAPMTATAAHQRLFKRNKKNKGGEANGGRSDERP
jgi:hypothetical protein